MAYAKLAKAGTLTAVILMLLAHSGASALLSRATRQDSAKPAMRTPVIVELFTSEGCSSCPPADALLAKLEAQQPFANAEVIALEEHVDYWDQLGWRDPYSSADWTARQQNYSQILKSGSVYTPQMIVNGTKEFVGSRTQQGSDAIAEAARQPATMLTVTAHASPSKRAAEVTVRVQQLQGQRESDQPEVWLAVTETGLHTAVAGGENAGHDLHHASVVRKLQKLGPAAPKSGSIPENPARVFADVKVSLDSAWKSENLHIVAFIQERHSLRIIGAAQTTLAP